MALRKERLLPLIVATALLVENMDSTAIGTSLPAIARDLGVAPVSLQLALTTYLIALAMFIPASGWIADRLGARPVFQASIGVFLLGSLACASSNSLADLVAGRFVQGIGGAMMVPVGRLVLLRSVPKAQLVQALSWLTIPALLGPMVGPPLGGLVTTYAHWRWIFLINVPIGLLGMWLAQRYVPVLRDDDPQPFDARGFALLAPGLGLAMFGLCSLGRHLAPGWLVTLCIAAGAGLLAAYAMHSRGRAHPLLDLGLLRLPSFRHGLLGGALFRIGAGALPFLLPLLLQLGFGLDPLHSGLITFTGAVGAMAMKPLAPGILHRHGFRRVLIANALAASAVMCAYALFAPDSPVAFLVAVLFASGCLRSLQFTSLNALVYADVGQDRMGQASGLAAMVQQLAMAIGVSVGGYALVAAGAATGEPPDAVVNFGLAFLAVSLVSASSALVFARLAPDAGAEMAGHAEPGKELREPQAEQRPAV
jgi:EmrB/QacA subfamily drug resistance transporter